MTLRPDLRTLPRRGLVAVALLLVLALVTAGCALLGGDDPYEIEVEFARTFNLFPGSPVRVLGVDVGQVVDLRVEPGDESVTARLRIDGDVRLPADAGALIVPEALLGERYVQIEPAYTTGPELPAGGTISRDRTTVPFEFDEVLENLNQFVGGLEPDEVGRFVGNLAEVLDGNGEALGRTIDNAHTAVEVLEENDQELLQLAGRLADLNETLATRDEEIGAILEDWNTVASTISDDRGDLAAALDGLVRLTTQLSQIMGEHRVELQQDVETLTRVGRTANRNLDQISLSILGGAELFRHAERVIDRERHNWLPLVNHTDRLGRELAETIASRLQGICLAAGLDPSECAEIPLADVFAGELCLPGVLECEPGQTTAAEALREIVRDNPALGDAIVGDELPDLPGAGDGSGGSGSGSGSGDSGGGSGGSDDDPIDLPGIGSGVGP